jgi:hypothetical protein
MDKQYEIVYYMEISTNSKKKGVLFPQDINQLPMHQKRNVQITF